MTDRVDAFTIVLDKDVREDDVEFILNAIRMIKGVMSVEPHIADISSEGIGRMRMHAILWDAILKTLRDHR